MKLIQRKVIDSQATLSGQKYQRLGTGMSRTTFFICSLVLLGTSYYGWDQYFQDKIKEQETQK